MEKEKKFVFMLRNSAVKRHGVMDRFNAQFSYHKLTPEMKIILEMKMDLSTQF